MADALLEALEQAMRVYPEEFKSRFQQAAAEELRAALKPKAKKPSVKVKAAKRATKNEQTAEIRAAVVERADGCCELCALSNVAAEGTDLHHAFGRVRVPQAVSNCILLCRWCHRGIEGAKPAVWLVQLARHFRKHGYSSEERRLAATREWKDTKKSIAAFAKEVAR